MSLLYQGILAEKKNISNFGAIKSIDYLAKNKKKGLKCPYYIYEFYIENNIKNS